MKFIYVFITLISITMRTTAQRQEAVIEIRTYTIKTGMRDRFHQIVDRQAIPLLNKWKINVSSYGVSANDDVTYYLIRSFDNLEHLNRSEDAFYNSADWKQGPRESILALIQGYTTLVVPVSTFQSIRHPSIDDQKQLKILNSLFIRNFINQDTTSHNDIIHKDFVCIENSGAIVSRRAYMQEWAHAYSKDKFTSFTIVDEQIRIYDHVALVRSKTNYTKMVDGEEVKGSSVYTDTYYKENGRWWCVQAQITPVK